MSITTSQQITKYYEVFRAIDVTFTREVIKTIGLDAKNVFLKCVGEQWPCVIHTTSFVGAKVIASSKSPLIDKIKKANNSVSLRFSFRFPDKTDPVSFFVSGRVQGFSPYAQASDLQFISILYTQRPPDDLIELLGRFLEANVNSTRRADERILINPDNQRHLGLAAKETIVFIQGVPRKCILRDLSFGGAKVILVGLAKFLIGKECSLRIEFTDPAETLDIKGSFVRYEDVEGRKDLAAVAVHYDEAAVPMNYKMHINAYVTSVRKGSQVEEQPQAEERPAADKSAPAKPDSAKSDPG